MKNKTVRLLGHLERMEEDRQTKMVHTEVMIDEDVDIGNNGGII